MITLGDIFEKPKIVLFPEYTDDKFYNNCKERESVIKRTVSSTLKSFNIHVLELEKNRSLISNWKKERIKSCMTNLGDYLEYLINELNKKKIEDHCKREEILGENFIPFLPDIVLIMINSYHGAVETDLHWIPDLTMRDSYDISNGDFDFNKLKKYLPQRIIEIEKLFREQKNTKYVNDHFDSINEAISCFKSGHKKASNLLLLTIIEGLVRSLGIYLKEKQGLVVDPTDKRKYASLDSFLNKIPWKKDLKIGEIKYSLLTGNQFLNKGTKEDFIIVNLTERLGFLCRRFKENRNSILHGEETKYANSLNSFLNFSALKEVLLTIKDYNELYN